MKLWGIPPQDYSNDDSTDWGETVKCCRAFLALIALSRSSATK
jgi:hypothetical protein